jgi:PhnB protein
MIVQPYLFFEGRCEEALDFYCAKLGAQVDMLMRFQESPVPCDPKMVSQENLSKVMHASFRVGDTVLMGSDGYCQGDPKFTGFSLSLAVPDEATADRHFAALSDGGQVVMPLTETFYSPRFGMVTDRFGILWMIIVPLADETGTAAS